MALKWLDLISDPRFSALGEEQRRQFRENWLRDKVYKNPYVQDDNKQPYADWFREKTEYTMEEYFNPEKDKDEGMTPYMKAAAHGVAKGLTGGWLGLGGRERLYDTEEERAMMDRAGLQTEKKWGWIDDAEEHPWVSFGGELASFAVPLGILGKVAYIPKALRMATGGTRAAKYAWGLARAGLRGGEVGMMYGLMRKPSGEEWETVKSPFHAPWTDTDYIKQKVADTLIDAGIFAGADMVGHSIGAAWKAYNAGNYKKSVREMTKAANEIKKSGKLATNREAMFQALTLAKEQGLEMPEIVGEVAKALEKKKIPKERVGALVEQWMKPTRKMKELQQLDDVFRKLDELGGARLAGEGSKQLELLKTLREANPGWTEEKLAQGVFDAMKEGKPGFAKAFGEEWVPKYELRLADKPVPMPSRMGKEDLQSTVHNLRHVLEEMVGETAIKGLGKRASQLYDKTAILGTDIMTMNNHMLKVSKLPLKPSEKTRLYEWLIHLNSAKRAARMLGAAPRDFLTLGDEAFTKWHATTLKGQLAARYMRDTAEKIPFLRDSKSGRRIFYLLNNADDVGRSMYKDFGAVTDAEREFADILRAEWDELFKIARGAGIDMSYRTNYAPLIWKNAPGEIRKYLETAPDVFKEAEVVVPRRPGLRQNFRHAMQRKMELQDGLQKGLIPIEDPVHLMQSYQMSLYKTIANRNLVDTLQAMKIPFDGALVPVMTHANTTLPGRANLLWKELAIPGLMGKAKIAPPFYKEMTNVFDPWIRVWENKYYRAFSALRRGSKRLIMYNPMIHGANILSDVIAEQLTWNPISWPMAPVRAWKTMTRGAKLWKNRDAIVEEFVGVGGNLEGLRGLGNELWEGTRKLVLNEAPAGSWFAKWFKEPVKSVARISDRFLWDGIVRNAQLGLYQQLKPILAETAKKTGQKASQEVIQRAAAHYVNDLLGTLPPTVFTTFSREALSSLFFARNWTISNLRLITGALGMTRNAGIAGTKNLFGTPATAADMASGMWNKVPGLNKFGVFDFLRHGGIGRREMELIQGRYVKHLVKGVSALVASGSIFQVMLCSMMNQLRDRGILDANEWGPNVPVHGVFSNPAGHKLDVFTGLVDSKQRPVYMTNFLFRYIRDYFKWMAEPVKTLYNKMEPVSKGMAESLINYSVWRAEKITPEGEKVAAADWMEARGIPGARIVGPMAARAFGGGKYILESATPAEALWGVPGYDRSAWEWLPHLAGTYLRKGLTLEVTSWKTLRSDHKYQFYNTLSNKEKGDMFKQWQSGLFKGEVARKLLEYRQKWDYDKSKIDDQIDELLQAGRWDEAYRLAATSGRYLDMTSFRSKMRRYQGKILTSMRREEKERRERQREEKTPGKEYVY